MCSDESHFNVSLTVREKDARRCPKVTTVEVKIKAETRLSANVLRQDPKTQKVQKNANVFRKPII